MRSCETQDNRTRKRSEGLKVKVKIIAGPSLKDLSSRGHFKSIYFSTAMKRTKASASLHSGACRQ